MRRLALALLVGCALLPLAARAARIEGKVIHHEREGAGAGVRVDLMGVQRGGETIERSARADQKGGFVFADLPKPAIYLVMATYREIRFPGARVTFEESSPDTQAMDVHIYDQTDDPSGVVIEQVGWTVERLEAGSFRVEQRARIRNPHPRAIVVGVDAPPISRIGLAPGHGDVTSPFGGVPSGFEVVDAKLELRGPLLPGQRDVVFGYELEGNGGPFETEIAFPDPVEEFGLFVRDVGLRIDAGALHPGRPARDEAGVAYQHYLGFELPAGASFPLRIASRPPREGGGLPLAFSAALLTLAVALFVFAPLAAAAREAPVPVASDAESAEQEALYAALRELQHDYETGKLSDEDRARLRQELVREAAQERAARDREG
jgi:cytochrome c-type biogenesis protein CcmI